MLVVMSELMDKGRSGVSTESDRAMFNEFMDCVEHDAHFMDSIGFGEHESILYHLSLEDLKFKFGN